jgi:hypothetical protein
MRSKDEQKSALPKMHVYKRMKRKPASAPNEGPVLQQIRTKAEIATSEDEGKQEMERKIKPIPQRPHLLIKSEDESSEKEKPRIIRPKSILKKQSSLTESSEIKSRRTLTSKPSQLSHSAEMAEKGQPVEKKPERVRQIIQLDPDRADSPLASYEEISGQIEECKQMIEKLKANKRKKRRPNKRDASQIKWY